VLEQSLLSLDSQEFGPFVLSPDSSESSDESICRQYLTMSETLPYQLAFCVVLITSLTTVGLLALWAATTPRHWFVQAAVYLAVLAPLLVVPAQELFVGFVIQGVVIAAGVQLFRRRLIGTKENQPGIRFSLSTLLLILALVAVTTLIAMRLPRLTWRGWTSLVLIGIASGLVTLLASGMARARRKLLAWPTALVLCLTIGFFLMQWEWFAAAVVHHTDWPPQPPPPPRIAARNPPLPPVIVWLITLPTIAVLLSLILMLYELARTPQRKLARVSIVTLVVLIAALPLGIAWKLLNPRAIPVQQLPQPNSYDDFVAAGSAFNSSPILSTNVQPTSTAQLAAEVASYSASFDQVHNALNRPCKVPLPLMWPNMEFDFPWENVQKVRSVARALGCKADLARQQQRFHDAASVSLETMNVGIVSARGGVVPHYLVGIAVEGIGMSDLYAVAQKLDEVACGEVIRSLEEIEAAREPVEPVIDRDRGYCENVYGWYGHLLLMLDDLASSHPGYDATRHAYKRSSAVRRLLTLELTLRRYRLENGALPQQLDALVPHYISRVPVDPFDADGSALHYLPKGDSYVVYSIGFDGDDDGGRPTTKDRDWMGDGDLRLDNYFENW
jgi:hypothetical protein